MSAKHQYSERELRALRSAGDWPLDSVREATEIFVPPKVTPQRFLRKKFATAAPVPAPATPPTTRAHAAHKTNALEVTKNRAKSEPRPVCLDYLKGQCDEKRYKCKFAHPPQTIRAPQIQYLRSPAEDEGALVLAPKRGSHKAGKADVCPVWILTGFCKFGNNCRDYHPPLDSNLVMPCRPVLPIYMHESKAMQQGAKASNGVLHLTLRRSCSALAVPCLHYMRQGALSHFTLRISQATNDDQHSRMSFKKGGVLGLQLHRYISASIPSLTFFSTGTINLSIKRFISASIPKLSFGGSACGAAEPSPAEPAAVAVEVS